MQGRRRGLIVMFWSHDLVSVQRFGSSFHVYPLPMSPVTKQLEILLFMFFALARGRLGRRWMMLKARCALGQWGRTHAIGPPITKTSLVDNHTCALQQYFLPREAHCLPSIATKSEFLALNLHMLQPASYT